MDQRTIDLLLWSPLYAAAWTAKFVGLDLKAMFPNMAKAETKPEEALQQFAVIGLLFVLLLVTAGFTVALIVCGILAVIKIYNLIRIDLTK